MCLAQIMACHLFGDKPGPKPILAYCHLNFMNYFNQNIETMHSEMSSAKWQSFFKTFICGDSAQMCVRSILMLSALTLVGFCGMNSTLENMYTTGYHHRTAALETRLHSCVPALMGFCVYILSNLCMMFLCGCSTRNDARKSRACDDLVMWGA